MAGARSPRVGEPTDLGGYGSNMNDTPPAKGPVN